MSSWPLRVMVYGAGDAINGEASLTDPIKAQLARLGQVATNRTVAAVAELDSSTPPSVRYVLDPAHGQPMESLPEVDTGDPEALLSFARWSAWKCPAEVSVLVLSGHGAAWEDSLVDGVLVGSQKTRFLVPGALRHPRRLVGRQVTTSGSITRAVLLDGDSRDYLSNAELAVVCERIAGELGGRIDVLVFDACLMSAWEILTELAGSVRAVVASIDELSAAGIDLAGPMSRLSDPQAARDHRSVAATVAGGFAPEATFDSIVAVDLVDPAFTEAVEHFRAFCAVVTPWVASSDAHADALRHALLVASTSVVNFTSGGLADLGAFASAVADVPDLPPEAGKAVAAAAERAAACVVARSAGHDYRDAMGMSVFCPPNATLYGSNRPDYVRLRFATETGWSGVLDLVHGWDAARSRFV